MSLLHEQLGEREKAVALQRGAVASFERAASDEKSLLEARERLAALEKR